jgi:hypothetical protein
MNKTPRFTIARLGLLALLATVVSAGLLSAEDYKGTFTLPFEVRWGSAVLPAGDYSFTIDTARDSQRATVRWENGAAMVMPSSISDRQFDGHSALILTRRGHRGTVRALALATPGTGSRKGGLVFSYAPPKGEAPLLAQAPELIQRIPVTLIAAK